MPTETHLYPPSKSTSIPIVEPHLMPFHIDYSGYAPISTYFRVKPALTIPLNGDEEEKANDPPRSSNNNKIQRLKKRVVSAFRGRRLKGLVVDVPEGYTGVILQADDEPQDDPAIRTITESVTVKLPKKRPVSPKKGKRRTRRDETKDTKDSLDDGDENAETEQSATETRVLRPVGKFDSITIWNSDVDVDETYDEYIRTLDCYRRLLEEIHRIEPTPST